MVLPKLLAQKQNKENLWGDESKQDHFNFFGTCKLCIIFLSAQDIMKLWWYVCYLQGRPEGGARGGRLPPPLESAKYKNFFFMM